MFYIIKLGIFICLSYTFSHLPFKLPYNWVVGTALACALAYTCRLCIKYHSDMTSEKPIIIGYRDHFRTQETI